MAFLFVWSLASASKIDRVLVLGLDGLGGNYIKNATLFAPNMFQVFKDSLVSFNMRAQYPAVSAPNWGAILTGMTATETGISDNDFDHEKKNPAVCPTSGCTDLLESFIDVAHIQNPAIKGLIVSAWPWIDGFALRRNFIENPKCGEVDDDCVEQHVVAALDHEDGPQLIFTVFESIDSAGHDSYWGSRKYYDAVQQTDDRVARILQHVDDHTLVVITADHGGIGGGHGGFDKSNLESFFAYYVKNSSTLLTGELPFAGSNVKIAPTILHALGLSPGHYMGADPLSLFGQFELQIQKLFA
jgi:predicted AlkP superfamily pyrophosphatase or phosphodiesterase